MPAPTVSVVMPVFNAGPFLPAAIGSVRAQTLADFELLIVDGGSTDGSRQTAEEYCRADARLRLLDQPLPGVSAVRNLGMQHAAGKYLAWLDADDLAHAQRLELQAAYLDAHPEVISLGAAYRQIDAHGRVVQVHRMPQADSDIRWHALFHSPFAQSSLMVRLDVLRRLDMQYAAVDAAEDYELSSRLLEHGRAHNLAQALIDYRLHPGQLSQVAAPLVEHSATQVARRNLSRIGVDLDLQAVARLRTWYYRFPRRLERGDLPLALTLLEIVDVFARRPGLEARRVRRIRGRAVLRILRAGLPRPSRAVLGCLRPDRSAAALATLLERLAGRGN